MILDKAKAAQQELNDKIVALIAGTKAKEEADATSPKKGVKFEDTFAAWIQTRYSSPNPLIASHVGSTNGSMGKKVGDIVMRSTACSLLELAASRAMVSLRHLMTQVTSITFLEPCLGLRSMQSSSAQV